MVTGEPPEGIRIGSAERDAALQALGEHMRAGRLDPEEYGERAGRASAARYASELEALFRDLPPTRAPRPDRVTEPYVDERGRRPLGGRAGATAVALTPFVAVILFFLVGSMGNYGWSWLFFLAIPIVGIIVYGDADAHRRRDDRHRR